MQKALFPADLGGWGLGNPITFFHRLHPGRGSRSRRYGHCCGLYSDLLAAPTILVEPHVNHRLAAEFAPMFCKTDKAVFAALAMTEPQGGADIENMELLGGKTSAPLPVSMATNGSSTATNSGPPTPAAFGSFSACPAPPVPARRIRTISPSSSCPPTSGVTQGGPYEKAGMAADKNGDIWFEDVRVPPGTAPMARVKMLRFSRSHPLGTCQYMGFSSAP